MTNITIAAPTTAPRTAAPTAQEKPKAQLWLNVGINVPMPNPETGEVEDVFVSLPFGIPVDTMEKATFGKNENWNMMAEAKNAIREALLNAGKPLESGHSTPITGLELELRRVGEIQMPASGENPLLAAVVERMSAGAKQETKAA